MVGAAQGDGMIFSVFAAAVIGGISLDGGKGALLGAMCGVLVLGLINDILTLAGVSGQWIRGHLRLDHPGSPSSSPGSRAERPRIDPSERPRGELMETIALHTVLKAGREGDYDRIHATIPAELDAALRAAGVHQWRIWRDGRDLFHVVDCDDYKAMRAALRDHPANIPWQARMAELLEVEDDYSGRDSGMRAVWSLE